MNRPRSLVLIAFALIMAGLPRGATAQTSVDLWLTSPDGEARFALQKAGPRFGRDGGKTPQITIDPAKTYQGIDGFGTTLTGGSAHLIAAMSAKARSALLRELFATDGASIGMSYLRISIGASDLDAEVFSYDDLPAGQADLGLKKFTLDPDRRALIPVLMEILTIAPDLKIMGSPWSPPVWMKDNGQSKGGSLKPEYYRVYADYLVKYVLEMRHEGIRIDAITPQNEPLHPGNNPSLFMPAAQQSEWIKNHLGPAFRDPGLDTKIIVYDHNCDHPEFPISILDDPETRKFVDGSAFHLYAGQIGALSKVHDAHPDKNVYFTEQWIGAPGHLKGDLDWHTRELTIGATRNWSRTVLEWNLTADPKQEPHTPGGCSSCLGALTIDGDKVTRNPAYYVVAHASKFVRPGSVRIASTEVPSLPNVAFRTPEGRKVLIVLNDSGTPQSFQIREGTRSAPATLPSGAVATYVWK